MANQTDREAAPPATGIYAAVSRSLRRPLASYHLVLGSGGLLLLLGLVMVFSASTFTSQSAYGDPYRIFVRQVVLCVVGVVIGWLAARSKLSTVRRLALPLLVIAIGLLVATYVPGLGVTVNGTRAWLDLGSELFRIQPSELAKLGLILWGANTFARKGPLLRQWKHIALPFVPVSAIVVALTVGQNDLGTSLILMGIMLAMLWVLGVPTWLFGLSLGGVGVVATYFITNAQHRLNRVSVFLDPWQDPDRTGYQSIHAIYAFAEGGWWGRGLGASSEKLGRLPEAHTDFIFAIIGEELGLPGTFVVIGLFGMLGYAGIRIAWRARDPFVRLAAAGITAWLVGQSLVNLSSVLGVLPVVGVPLPLVSYGGSALVPTIAAIGLLVCFAKEEPGARAALKVRRRKS
ncbi:MAG TPA: putative lipid II flippase FtsW [Jiangellaceae bacterium]|nr:putative lipid II flippase FtsW [Jiangellaceae bacterium]